MDVASRQEWEALPQIKRRHASLQPEDTEERTFGCRASNPEVCGKHRMPSVCAFVREDGICLAPPRSWAKQYSKLLAAEQAGQPSCAGRDAGRSSSPLSGPAAAEGSELPSPPDLRDA